MKKAKKQDKIDKRLNFIDILKTQIISISFQEVDRQMKNHYYLPVLDLNSSHD